MNAWTSLPARIFVAAIFYFAIVFAVGFLLGTVRVLWIEPSLGEVGATLCEMPFLIAAMIVAARFVSAKMELRARPKSLLLMGVGALVLQQLADFAVGIMRGTGLAGQLHHFKTPAGLIYLGALLVFAAMPVLAGWRKPHP